MSLLGKIAKGIAGFATGGPVGAIQAITRKQQGSVGGIRPDSIITRSTDVMGGLYRSNVTKTYPGSIDGGSAGPYGGMQVPALSTGAACPVGYRLNKSTYITRGGGTSRWGPAGSITVHPKGTTCVKRRRRNVGNARALRRAISRVKGFVKLARKAHSLVGGGHRRPKQLGRGGQNIEIVRG